jgi:type II secretory pathway component PulF
MEFEDHYVTCSLKHTMEHWLWCAVLLIEVFGLFWCLMVGNNIETALKKKSRWYIQLPLNFKVLTLHKTASYKSE